METKELRIGNYVGHCFLSKDKKEALYYSSIHSIHPQNTVCLMHNPFQGLTNIVKPIPLTKDWIINLGFNDDYKKGYLGINYGNTDFVLTEPLTLGKWQETWVWEFTASWPKFVEIKYVHELQNLFYGLTKLNLINKELHEKLSSFSD